MGQGDPEREYSLDQDLAELREISIRLDNAEPDEKVTLRERQRELRARWKTGYEAVSAEKLAELEQALSRQREELMDRRLDMGATGAGSGFGGGLDALATMQHNRRVDETHGRAETEQELLRVRAELARRTA